MGKLNYYLSLTMLSIIPLISMFVIVLCIEKSLWLVVILMLIPLIISCLNVYNFYKNR